MQISLGEKTCSTYRHIKIQIIDTKFLFVGGFGGEESTVGQGGACSKGRPGVPKINNLPQRILKPCQGQSL